MMIKNRERDLLFIIEHTPCHLMVLGVHAVLLEFKAKGPDNDDEISNTGVKVPKLLCQISIEQRFAEMLGTRTFRFPFISNL